MSISENPTEREVLVPRPDVVATILDDGVTTQA